jgi:hypothetical protein
MKYIGERLAVPVAIERPLRTLRLVIPGRYSNAFMLMRGNIFREYAWHCGCSASGSDEQSLTVERCIIHFHLLAGHDTKRRLNIEHKADRSQLNRCLRDALCMTQRWTRGCNGQRNRW